jgi:predicted translin family RNA/ssDNA-binding protein
MAVFFFVHEKACQVIQYPEKIKCELRHKFDLKSKKIILELVDYRKEQRTREKLKFKNSSHDKK